MNPEKETEILEMDDNGMKVAAIAEEMELSATAVRNILKKHGRDLSLPKAFRDEEAIINQYIQNTPIHLILTEHDLTYSVLYGILSKHKVTSRKTANAESRQQRFDVATEMYQNGNAIWQIINETGIAQPTLHAELHKRDIPLRRAFTRAGTSLNLSAGDFSEEVK